MTASTATRDALNGPRGQAPPGAGSTVVHPETDASPVTRVAAAPLIVASVVAGAAVAVAGLLTAVPLLFALGGLIAGLGALAAALLVPEVFVLVFIVGRPMVDIGPTYAHGPNVNMPVAGLLLLALGSWGWRERRSLSVPSASAWAAVLLATAGLLSVLGSRDVVQSANMALRLVTIVALFVFAEQIGRRDPTYLPRLVLAIVGSVLLAAVVGAAQLIGIVRLPIEVGIGGLIDAQEFRVGGPYPAATVFATHLFVGVGLLLLVVPRLWLSGRGRLVIPHAIALAGLFGWIMVENQSRSPAIAVLIALAVATVTRWRVVGVAFTLMVILGGLATLDAEGTRIDEVGSGSTPGAEADTLQWRLSYWERNLPRIADNPLTGIGLGRVEQLNSSGQPPHNTAVQSIVEMGAFGAATYAGLLAFLARDLWRALLGSRGTRNWDLMVVVTGMCLGYGFIGMFENLLTQVVTSGPMAMITGVALGCAHRDMNRAAAQ